MRIGFVGAGNIGGALASNLVALGHDVAMSNSRGPQTLAELVRDLGPTATAVTHRIMEATTLTMALPGAPLRNRSSVCRLKDEKVV